MSEPKPYPGIPAGILDEDLEEYMNETKGLFDATIIYLGYLEKQLLDACPTGGTDVDSIHSSIRVLEAAGKVNKKRALKLVGWLKDVGEHEDIHWSHGVDVEYVALYAFLESLPDKEGK